MGEEESTRPSPDLAGPQRADRLAKDNPRRGYRRIQGELRKRPRGLGEDDPRHPAPLGSRTRATYFDEIAQATCR